MIYTFMNLSVLIGVYCFYKFCLKKQITFDTSAFFPLTNICVLQALFVCVLFVFENFNLHFHLLTRIYIFSIYYSFIVLFRFACTYEVINQFKYIKHSMVIFLIPMFYYCFFYLDINHLLVEEAVIIQPMIFFQGFDLGHYAYTPYIFILPLLSILILVLRSIFTKDMVLKFKLILIIFVFASLFFFYIILVFGGSYKRSFNYLFSLVTLYTILLLYRISLISHVSSMRRAYNYLKTFFFEYMLFAVVVTFVFIVFFYALSINLAIFSILGLMVILLLFFGQALARKKNKSTFIQDVAHVVLGNFFTNIDYNQDRTDLLNSFSSMLTKVFDASGIEYFILEGEELHVVHSTRNFYTPKLSIHSKLYTDFCQSKVSVISKTSLNTEKQFFDVHDELESFMSYSNSYNLILLHGERHLIGIISFGPKMRSVHYSKHDESVMKYFYTNFFVFGYYLQISMKETLMKIISREIEFSGQVTESVYKNVDPINNLSIDLGYLSRSPRNLGGDFIDLIRLTDTRHMFVIGDVSGRGLNASMCMIILKSFIRTFLRDSSDFIGLLNKLNSFIKHNLPRGTFFAGTFIIYDSSNSMLYYVNCGVPGIFLYTKSYNNVIEIQGEGKVLGFVDNISELLTVKKIQLNKGDVILTCSDGVTDSLSLRGEEYGKRRIEKLLQENRSFPAQNICSFLFDDLQSFTAKGITDDVSILVLKIVK